MTIQIHMTKIVSRVALLLLPLLLVPLIIPPQVVSAKTPATESGSFTQVDVKARSWALAVFATSDIACGNWFAREVSVDAAKGAAMYSDGKAAGDSAVNAGYVVAPGTADSVDCEDNGDNWLSSGLDLWGYKGDYQEFLYDLGYRQDGLPEDQYNLPYSQLPLNDQTWYERSGRPDGNTIAQLIKSNGGPDANNPAADVKYYATYTNFVLGCEASPLKLLSEATNNEKSGDTAYVIKDVDPATGQIREMVYTATKGKGDRVSTGPGVISPNENFPTCQQLADQLNQSALINAYSTYWKNAIAAGRQPLSNSAPVTGDGNSGNTNETDASCGDVGGAFGWLICAAADVVDGLASWVESQLYELLRMKEIGGVGSPVYTAWSSIRNVATAVLVLVALVAIAAQIFNLDFISAYTMKKMIPRIVIASILLFVSYFLAAMAIQFVNALGDGIGALIMGPFGDLAEASANGDAIQYILSQMDGLAGGEAAAASAILLGVGATAFIGGAGLGGIILILFLVGGAIAVAFVTLVLRKVLILALIMAMPLAIIAWILPGTQKWFTSWWNLFTKLLLMYPLVIGLIATGRVAAYLLAIGASTASGAASIPGVWQTFAVDAQVTVILIMVLVAYFGPYYFIPSMFKTAGGLFNKAISAIDGAGRKYARKAGGASSKFVGDYAASKYKPGANGFKGKIGNAAVRASTGRITPTKGPVVGAIGRKQLSDLTKRGSSYTRERTEAAEYLMTQAEKNMSHADYLKYLESQGGSNDEYVAQAAHNKLVDQKGYAELDRIRHKKGEAEFIRRVAQGNTYGSIKQANRSLLPSDTALAIENGTITQEVRDKLISDANAIGISISAQSSKGALIEAARNVERRKNLSSMSADEIASSHDSLYESEVFDENGDVVTTVINGKVVSKKHENTEYISDDSMRQILDTPTIEGRLTTAAKSKIRGAVGATTPAPTPGPTAGPATPIINTPLTPSQKAQAVRNNQNQSGPVNPRLSPTQINSMDATNITGWLQSRGGVSDPNVTTQELIAIRNSMSGRMNEPGMRDAHTDITLELASRGVIADPTDPNNQRPNLP